MFTIKFINHYDPRQTSDAAMSSETVVSCARYEVYRKANIALVTIYEKMTGEGVEFRVHGDPTISGSEATPLSRYFNTAFIENQSGKTIDRIGPYERYDWHGHAQAISGQRESSEAAST